MKSPGTLYVVQHRQPDDEADISSLTLVRITSGTGKYIAMFTSSDRANSWIVANAAGDDMKPLAIDDPTTLVAFLRQLAADGDTDVGIDPAGRHVNFAPIAVLIERICGA